jgi:hypothetical protein
MTEELNDDEWHYDRLNEPQKKFLETINDIVSKRV